MSCACQEQDFCVPAGETFRPTLRRGTGVYTSKPVTGITAAVPAVITAVAHGMPDGWPCALVGVQGMTQINATRYPPQGADYHFGTAIDANTVQLNDVSSAAYSAYTSGGFLVYDTPAAVLGTVVTMTIYDNPEFTGTPLATLTSPTNITLDDTLKTITPLLQTAGLTWTIGYFRMDSAAGPIVTELLRGTITIE